MRVHLVDGTFELFRAYFGAPQARNAQGREVGAARAFARSLNALLHQPGVTHIGVAFDHVIESFRNELFEGYKTGAGIEPDLLQQFELAEQATAALGVVAWPMVEFEADDALATGARLYAAPAEVTEVVICSPDKDLAQCAVHPKVTLWDRIRDRRLDADSVKQKFGVEPGSIPDYLALVGDSADGIPGVPRWGAKSSAQVLARYQHLEAIPKELAQWDIKVRGAQALLDQLRDQFDKALLYRRLATLRSDVPLREELGDLCYRGADPALLQRFCEEVAEGSLLSRVRWA